MGTSRRRVLFIGELITLSHMVRPAVLAKTLDPKHYDVFFACDARHIGLLGGDYAFQYIPLTSRMADISMADLANGFTPLYDYETINHYVREDLALFDTYQPDIVVGDMRQSLIISSRLRKLPFVNIQNAYWHPDAKAMFDSPVNPLGAFIGEPWGRLLFNGVMHAMMPFVGLPINLVSIRYGLPIVGLDLKTIISYGDYTIFPDIPDLSPLPVLPLKTAYVGPCIWSPTIPQPSWWEQVPTDRPIISIGLGSSGQPRLLPVIVEALQTLPVTLLVSTAGRVAVETLSERVFVTDYIDGLEAARRSQVVICNGGSTAAPQGLAAGTPVLGITSNIDQTASMQSIVNRGAGEMIPEVTLTPKAVREATWKLLRQPGYKQAAQALAEKINRFDTGQALNRVMDRVFADFNL